MAPGILHALEWTCDVKDAGVLAPIAQSLPPALQREQVAAHRKSMACPVAATAAPPEQKRRINPHLVRDRHLVCAALRDAGAKVGWDGVKRMPHGFLKGWVGQFTWPKGLSQKKQTRLVGRWWHKHKAFVLQGVKPAMKRRGAKAPEPRGAPRATAEVPVAWPGSVRGVVSHAVFHGLESARARGAEGNES